MKHCFAVSQAHEFADHAVRHFDGADQYEHVEYKPAYIAPDLGDRRRASVHRRRAGREHRVDDAGEHDDRASRQTAQ